MFTKKFIVSLVGLTLILGCANYTKSKIPFSEEQLKNEQESIIYIYRLKNMVGGIVGWKVYLDKTVVGTLNQGAYMVLHVASGVHSVDIGEARDADVNTAHDFTNSVSKSTGDAGMNGAAQGSAGEAAAAAGINAAGANNVHQFSTKPGENYYVRSDGPTVLLVAKEQALNELKNMKLDMGK
jgi:hypothetical protein